ncbi:MAG: hypothetical protein ACI84C_001257 [Flavobacteriales bacterium]|jgi:hypothetical protein
MKNLIVSMEKLPTEILSMIEESYPDGYDHATFDLRIPTQNEVYTALRMVTPTVNYIIKLAKKKIDRSEQHHRAILE